MLKRFFLLALLALLIAGCRSGGDFQPFCGLQRGMTQQQFLFEVDRQCGSTRSFYGALGATPVPKGPGPDLMPGGTWDQFGNPDSPTWIFPGGAGAGVAAVARVKDDVWNVWSYRVHPLFVRRAGPREYAVFKNNQLVFWGEGKPPRQLLEHPETVANLQ